MAVDIVPVLAGSLGGSTPSWGLTSVVESAFVAGGMDYVPDAETMEADPHCTAFKADGHRCGGWASGEDGLCAGHRKQAEARSR